MIPLFFEAMSSENSELTLSFLLVEVFVFVMDVPLELYNLHFSAKSHLEPGQFLHARNVEYPEEEDERQCDCPTTLWNDHNQLLWSA